MALVLAGAALGGPRWSVWALVYRHVVRFFVGPPAALEDPRGPRFATQLGFAFSTASFVTLVSGMGVLALVGWALALVVSVLALLAAGTGFCVACKFYGLYARLNVRAASP